MGTLKANDIKGMSKEEQKTKLKELKMELIKSKANATKSGGSKTREIKRLIARILTLNK
ncbi:50S ribosomal protein L29 [Candidatus Pacearchaeota archaeon]|nr:50S ribosomal protein L29 [Candidatus Pacearchaeota archaeon]